uniref:Uncharacterized protein n=1 Tax=Strombidium inclinatum TaxID=197538 RepID=A0A7S3IQY0_9SPIT|mmetsp:Transcript_32469/g.49683  ORF Transcript_32469/g.49683 Transcript_32469/m.49683 type:complete len:158 (+) Transcript_32469:28-501(+)
MSKIIGHQGFPAFDNFHCHCALNVTFTDKSCEQAFNIMKDKIELWHPEPGANGSYKIWDAVEEEQIWATRTTPTKGYVDDILFDYFGDPKDFEKKGCSVSSKSRSQTLSFYDYHTNYCNMWNVLNEVEKDADLLGDAIEVSDCKWAPKDPATTCAKY